MNRRPPAAASPRLISRTVPDPGPRTPRADTPASGHGGTLHTPRSLPSPLRPRPRVLSLPRGERVREQVTWTCARKFKWAQRRGDRSAGPGGTAAPRSPSMIHRDSDSERSSGGARRARAGAGGCPSAGRTQDWGLGREVTTGIRTPGAQRPAPPRTPDTPQACTRPGPPPPPPAGRAPWP